MSHARQSRHGQRDGAGVVGVHGVFVDEEVPEPEGLC